MDDSWDLLHETMEKVNNFLGDYWFNEIEEANIGDVSDYVNSDSNNDVGHHHSQLSMLPQILSGSNHQIGEYECEITPEEGADMLAEEMEIVPQARARSNTWPRRQFSQQSVPVLPLVCEENFSDTGSGILFVFSVRGNHHNIYICRHASICLRLHPYPASPSGGDGHNTNAEKEFSPQPLG